MESESTQPALDNKAVQDIFTFLRQENDANRKALRDDADANRSVLLGSLKILSYPLAAVLGISAFIGWRSFTELKSDLRSEAEKATKTEIVRMQEEIGRRLDQQFQTPALQKMVKDTAREQTATALQPIIRSETEKQVKSRVDAERGTIQAAVTQQTQNAVKQMGGKIDNLVRLAVDAKATAIVQPVAEKVDHLKQVADLQVLVIRMNADDAEAFDALMKTDLTTLDEQKRKMITSALQSTVYARNSGMFMTRSFQQQLTEDQLIEALSSPIATSRQAALDTLIAKPRNELLPRIVQLLTADSSLEVRCAAYRAFNNWTKQQFKCLDKESLTSWWSINQSQFNK